MLLETFPVGPLQCNCTVLADEASGEAIVIDPGDDPRTILELIERRKLKVKALLHTHTHLDHVGGSAALKHATGAPVCVHGDDVFLYDLLPAQGALFGFRLEQPEPVDHLLKEAEVIRAGPLEVEVIHTPGHTPGSLTFRVTEGGKESTPLLLTGDTLFQGSIGRTDLWGGSFEEIMRSIHTKLLPFPDGVRVLPGHGPETTIGRERALNPFLAGE